MARGPIVSLAGTGLPSGIVLAFAPASPGTGERVVLERPPPGAARGLLPVPAALVAVLAASLVAVVIATLLLRARRR